MTSHYERLFFALWPEAKIRKELLQRYSLTRAARLGKPVAPSNLHITLHFLGNIPVHRIDCFLSQAEKLRAQPFSLNLTKTGYFKKPKVSWVGVDTVPDQLSRLHTELATLIQACGYHPEQRAYSPHVTMARKVLLAAPIEERLPPVVWAVRRFVLVQSISCDQSIEYRVKASFEF